MSEKKPRTTMRKTKNESSGIQKESIRKPLRRLPPSPGMDDIALPQELEANNESLEIDESIQTEDSVYVNHARSAIDAQNIHGSLHTVENIRTFNIVEDQTQSVYNEAPIEESFEEDRVQSSVVNTQDDPPKPIQDTNFLASEYTSFDLKSKKSRNWFATFIVWLLVILIIIGIAATVILYVYPDQATTWYKEVQTKVLHHNNNSQNNQNNNQQSVQTAAPITPSQTKFGVATSITSLAQTIDSAVQSKYSNDTIDSNVDPSVISSLNLSNDTLVYKSGVVDQVQQLSSYLMSQFGLQLQLEANDNIPDDIVLYLTPLISNPNLNGKTAIVYNAKGTPGAAKSMCQVLQSYKAGSCTPSNTTSPAQGLQVVYKDINTYMVLARTQQFQGATFQAAPASQTADFVVTIGK